ncbi:MAG: hypothetical protein CM1200mP16_16020 [Nitrospina sp.]|nr:MAG: hypothetical protein CM1200mP16_16020 [Nitrospina sp.]
MVNGFSKNDGYPRFIGINGMHSLPLKISENKNCFSKYDNQKTKII